MLIIRGSGVVVASLAFIERETDEIRVRGMAVGENEGYCITLPHLEGVVPRDPTLPECEGRGRMRSPLIRQSQADQEGVVIENKGIPTGPGI